MSDEQQAPPWGPDKSYFKVTLKGGKGYEATWVNIGAGTPGDLRRALIEFFGWDAAECEDKTPADLAFEATTVWHALSAIGDAFPDARPVGNHRGRSNAAEAYAAAQQQPAPDPKATLLAQIEQQADVACLKRLYAENKDMFDGNEELMSAYKSKGRSLSK